MKNAIDVVARGLDARRALELLRRSPVSRSLAVRRENPSDPRSPGAPLLILLDAIDERMQDDLTRVARRWTAGGGVVIVIVRSETQAAMDLASVAHRLQACAVAPRRPRGAATMAEAAHALVVGLLIPGVVGFDPADFAWLLRAPSTAAVWAGHHEPGIGRWQAPRSLARAAAAASRVLVTVGCDAATTLFDVNVVTDGIARRLDPDAELMVGAPETGASTVSVVTISGLASRCS